MQSKKRSEQSGASKPSAPPDTDRASTPDESREEEAGDTRSGRPMPEEDAANRTEHHKSGYGGEGGEPRTRPASVETGSKTKK